MTATTPSRMWRRIISGIVAGGGQTAVGMIVQFVQLPLVLAHLPAATAGTWFVFLSLGAYVSLFDLGISPTLSREIGFAIGQHGHSVESHKRVADLIATALRVFEIIAAVVFVVALTAGWWYLGRTAPPAALNEIRVAWAIFTAGAALNFLGGAAFAALYGMGDVSVERWARAATQAAGLAVTVAALLLGYGIAGLAAAWAVQGLAVRALGWLALTRRYPWLRGAGGRASAAVAQRIAAPSLKWAATSLGGTLILGSSNIIINSTLGPQHVPLYEPLVKIVNTAMGLALLIVISSTPFVSQLHAAGDRDGIIRLLNRNVRIAMAFMLTMVAALAVFGDVIVGAWIGPERFAGYAVLLPLLALLTLETHHVIHATVIMATGEIVFHWWAIGAGVLTVALAVILVGPLGLAGVAWGTLLAQVLTNNWYAPYYTLRALRVPLREYALETLAPLLALFAAVTGAGLAVRSALGHALSGAALGITGCVAVSVVAVALAAAYALTARGRAVRARYEA